MGIDYLYKYNKPGEKSAWLLDRHFQPHRGLQIFWVLTSASLSHLRLPVVTPKGHWKRDCPCMETQLGGRQESRSKQSFPARDGSQSRGHRERLGPVPD